MSEYQKVSVTIDDFTESFWVKPTGDHIGTVQNILLAGVIGLEDTVKWNDDMQVTELVKRSGRMTILLRPQLDDEDLAGFAEWQSAVEKAGEAFEANGVRGEGGFNNALLLSVECGEREVTVGSQRVKLRDLTAEDVTDDMVREWMDLIPSDTPVEYAVGSTPADPTDVDFLELVVPEVDRRGVIDDAEAGRVARLAFDDLTSDLGESVYESLIAGGHVNRSIPQDELIETAVIQVIYDARARFAWKDGRIDQVLVFAGRIEASNRGLMMPPLTDPVFKARFV